MQRIITILTLTLFCIIGHAKTYDIDSIDVVQMVILDNGDTLYMSSIEEVIFIAPPVFKNKREKRRYSRLVRNIKKVYPYSQMVKDVLEQIDDTLSVIPKEKQQKKYVKHLEKELMAEFEDELRKLTITQGRILIKLIDRETGDTSYELVEELRGKLTAFFWQAIARLFGSNLKAEFDAEGEDQLINNIVLMIENGQL